MRMQPSTHGIEPRMRCVWTPPRPTRRSGPQVCGGLAFGYTLPAGWAVRPTAEQAKAGTLNGAQASHMVLDECRGDDG